MIALKTHPQALPRSASGRAFPVIHGVHQMNKFARFGLVPASLALAMLSARAEVPATVTTALASLQADALTVAGVVLAAIVAVYAFKFIRKGL